MAVETLFAQLIAANNLTNLAVAMRANPAAEEYRWDATVHWDGFSNDSITCASGDGSTPSEAINTALREANAKRTPRLRLIDDFELPVLQTVILSEAA